MIFDTWPARRPAIRLVCLACSIALSGCAAQRIHDEGMSMVAQGDVTPALSKLKEASQLEPSNARFRVDYLTQRALLAQNLLTRGDEARMAGRLEEAEKMYREVLQQDGGNERALRGLGLVVDHRKEDALAAQVDRALKANQIDMAQDILKRGTANLPQSARITALERSVEARAAAERAAQERQFAAQAVFKRPVTLQFRDANLKMVFEALSRTSNVNIILDRDVKSDLKTTIYVKDASVEDTIDLILLQNQLEKRVLNNNTMFVYPSTPSKQKEYSELKVRSFHISNVDAAYMAGVIKGLLKTKDIVTDPRTNTLVMRDTPDAIAVAEKLINANDVPDAEIMLEVEVLEVSTDRLSSIGVKWPDSFGLATPSTVSTLGGLKALTRNELTTTPLGVALNLMLQDTETNILASPRIRTRNKEKARIMVGDKVPVITNLLTPQQAGQTSVITGSIQYVDVGLKLEVEPQVYDDGDVGIKINLEVSNIAKTIETASGVAYQIGSRNAQTSIRLKDGETQVLAGLISDTDRGTASKVPGLGQIPAVGRLFSSNSNSGGKSEIILSITPRIIRAQANIEARFGDVWSGTDAIVKEKQLRLDPIGAARAGAAGDLPGLIGGGRTGVAGQAVQPEKAKAGGAGGSNMLDPSRPGIERSTAAAGQGSAGAGASAGAAAGAAGAIAPTNGVASDGGANAATGTGAFAPGGNTTVDPAPRPGPPGYVPPTVRPGRAMRPATPSSPAGTPTTAPPPPESQPVAPGAAG
jgi:general secretion pathway protein D